MGDIAGFQHRTMGGVYRIARTGLGRTSVGYFYHEFAVSGIAPGHLWPAGKRASAAVLPLMIRAVSHEDAPLGLKVGTLLTWNTLGAVAGTLLCGFVLMPAVGLLNAFGILALILALAAAAWRGDANGASALVRRLA